MANEQTTAASDNTVPADLLEILVCPVDHAKVRVDGDFLVCQQCGRAYPIRDGIPVMLIEEAEQRTPPENAAGRESGAAEGAGT